MLIYQPILTNSSLLSKMSNGGVMMKAAMSSSVSQILKKMKYSADAAQPRLNQKELAYELEAVQDWRTLSDLASAWRDIGWGNNVSYSRKVFIPLTHLCRDVCHYCTFAKAPRVVG